MSQNRRNFFKIATLGAVGGLFGKLTEFAVKTSGKLSQDEFLVISELTTQRDALVDSIIRKNPEHVRLNEDQLEDLRREGREVLSEIYSKVSREELSEADMHEIALHLSQPVETKWQQFSKLAVTRAREAYISRVEAAIKKTKV
jgi:hypothetical protein